MKKVLLLLMTFTHLITIKAQYCIEDRFTQSNYFAFGDIIRFNDVSYGLADSWFGDLPQPSLNSFDIAYPNPDVDPLAKRPVIILAHGGGFWGGEKESLEYHLTELSQSGYVVVSMNYRKGWAGSPDDCYGDPASLSEAIYKAMQDVHACIRYLTANADTYGIDTAMMIAGGESAGVYAIMNAIFMTEEEWLINHPTHLAQFGPLKTSTNLLTNNFTLKGFVNMWGGLYDTAFIDHNEMQPLISFYGISDDVIPPTSGPIKFCEGFETVYGSESLQDKWNNNTICNTLNKNLMAGHEAYAPDYSTPAIACFVKSIMCNECLTDEENYEVAVCSDLASSSVYDLQMETILIAPNPASSYISVNLGNLGMNQLNLQFMDITGKLVDPDYKISGLNISVNVSNLAPGMYAIVAENNGLTASGKFIITR